MKKQQLNEIVARLVAQNGFTVNGITNSSFIRESISAKGYYLPKNPSKVIVDRRTLRTKLKFPRGSAQTYKPEKT